MGLFNWGKPKEMQANKTKEVARRPMSRDTTEDHVANRALTYGLYHGSYPGLKLASPVAHSPISIPVSFMGIPVPKSKNESTQARIDEIVKTFSGTFPKIHRQCHREGTIWVWPFYSSSENRIVWEFIHDDFVTDIIKDINTGAPISVIVDEEIRLSTGYNTTATVQRRRIFTRKRVTVIWSGNTVPIGVNSGEYRNPIAALPVCFANNADGNEIRGHSDYERILSDLKDYHDIDLKQSTVLAKFEPKMVQTLGDYKTWLATNGIADINELNIAAIDFIANVEGEKTEYIFPANAYQAYESALKRKFRKLVEGSGVPEILWGTKVEGNKASAQEQFDTLIKFIQEKQKQKNDPYQDLFTYSLNLLAARDMDPGDDELWIEWNSLDSVSEETRAVIFKTFAEGVATLITSAGATLEQIFSLWQALYPQATDMTIDEFKAGLSLTARHKAYSNLDYTVGLDLSGESDIVDNELND